MDADVRAIEEIAGQMADAFNARDAQKLASFYSETATLMPPDEPAISGRHAIEQWFSVALARLGCIQIVPAVSSISGDKAIQVGAFVATRSGGASPGNRTFKYVLIFKLSGNGGRLNSTSGTPISPLRRTTLALDRVSSAARGRFSTGSMPRRSCVRFHERRRYRHRHIDRGGGDQRGPSAGVGHGPWRGVRHAHRHGSLLGSVWRHGAKWGGLISIDLKVNFLSAASAGRLIATSRLIKMGKTLAYAEARVETEDGKVAHGTSTLLTAQGGDTEDLPPKSLPGIHPLA